MHITIENLVEINKEIKEKIKQLKYDEYNPNIVAVSKTFDISHISHLIDYGHLHFGENKVQETLEKWTKVKEKNNEIKLHMVGKLQTNKVKHAIKIFDYIHSVDSIKLINKIADEQIKSNKLIKLFIQVNLAGENQKSGITKNEIGKLIDLCKDQNLKVIGLMCLPPFNEDSKIYFSELRELNQEFKLPELSMGMSNDYLKAIEYKSSFLRIGSKIFGERN